MKGKKLIFILYQLLKYVLYINIVLAGGVLGFQILNIASPEKSLITSYLGKFVFELNAVGSVSGLKNELAMYVESTTGFAALGLDTHWHVAYVLIFTLLVGGVTLLFNYLFYLIFKDLNASVQQGTPFSNQIPKYLKQVSFFSILVFAVGSILSLLKVLIVKQVVFNNFVARPVYDNQLLNFLWFGLGVFILNEIYKVGIALKTEQDLTI
ncbi:MAG: DUF2975 domain-containing protein [Salinivirgaceae bacterium]|jgi:hypothetical protein|nr:DUF2975 domain-containing protein [Salinivirgaceae bacterium]